MTRPKFQNDTTSTGSWDHENEQIELLTFTLLSLQGPLGISGMPGFPGSPGMKVRLLKSYIFDSIVTRAKYEILNSIEGPEKPSKSPWIHTKSVLWCRVRQDQQGWGEVKDSRDPEEMPDTWDHLDQQDSRCVIIKFIIKVKVFILNLGKWEHCISFLEVGIRISINYCLTFVFWQGAAGIDGAPGARGQTVSVTS